MTPDVRRLGHGAPKKVAVASPPPTKSMTRIFSTKSNFENILAHFFQQAWLHVPSPFSSLCVFCEIPLCPSWLKNLHLAGIPSAICVNLVNLWLNFTISPHSRRHRGRRYYPFLHTRMVFSLFSTFSIVKFRPLCVKCMKRIFWGKNGLTVYITGS